MKKLVRTPKRKLNLNILFIVIMLVFAILLSGCTRKSDETYFLRELVNDFDIKFETGENKDFVTKNLTLDDSFRDAKIEWKSSHPEIIDINGVVKSPTENQVVTLSATFSVSNRSASKHFQLNAVSKETIFTVLYNDAFNKTLLFETKNDLTNYTNAKEAFELVDNDNPKYQELKEKFEVQEKIFLMGDKIREFIMLPSTELYNTLVAEIDELPSTNPIIIGHLNTLSNEGPHTHVGDSLIDLINDKTKDKYDATWNLLGSMPMNLSSYFHISSKLGIIETYLDDVDLLTDNTITQSDLEAMIVRNHTNELLNEDDYSQLINLYNSNQSRLFTALADLGYNYLETTLSNLTQMEKSDEYNNQKLIINHLIDNYTGDKGDELKASFALINLGDDLTASNLEEAKAINNLVGSEEVKASNTLIIDDYELLHEIQTIYLDLDEMLLTEIDFNLYKEKYKNTELLAENLTIESNIESYEKQKELYELVNNIIMSADEILTIDLKYDEGTKAYPLVTKTNESKGLGNNLLLNDYSKAKAQLNNLIEKNAISRLQAIKLSNEEEKNDTNRVIIVQLLGQINSKDYEVYQLQVYRDSLNRSVRVNTASKFTSTLIAIFLGIVALLVMQAMTADYASKKGYEGLIYSLIAIIPIGGWYYFYRKPKRRNISQAGIKHVYRPQEVLAKVVIYGQIVLISVIVLIPIIYIFGMAFSDLQSDIPSQIWPDKPTWNSFNYLLTETKFKTWWLNTAMIALVNMIIGTVLITGASYVFARFSFKGKKAGLLTILVLQAFPSFMGLIAMYVLFWKFGMLGRPLALTILYIGGGIPGNIWLIKGFMDQIPKDLDESAMIDGANKLQIFFRIIMPLAVPILTFVAVGMFMSPWMDYMLPGYLLNIPRTGVPADYDITQQWTLAVGLFQMINNLEYLHYSAFAAGALIVGMPITILYMLFQKYLIEGIMAGATKG